MDRKENVITEGEILEIPAPPTHKASQQEQEQPPRQPQRKPPPPKELPSSSNTRGSSGKTCANLPGMSPAERQKIPDLWSSPRSNVKGILAEDCEQMLHDNITGGLERDVMLVVYAPWCPFCKEIESSVEQLAHGLRNDRTVSIMKLRGDSAATRLWLRAQLGVETFPAILGFPQDGGGPLRYIGPRDTASLLEFMNVHCRTVSIGGKPLSLENRNGVVAANPIPLSFGPPPKGGSWIVPAVLAAGAVVAVIATQLLRKKYHGAAERVKSVKPRPSDPSAVSSTDIEELDGSIRNLLKLLIELISLRLDLVWKSMCQRLGFGRAQQPPGNPPQSPLVGPETSSTRKAGASPTSDPAA